MGSTQFVVVNRQLALECFLSFSSIVRNGRHGQFSTSFIVLHGRHGQFLTSFIVLHGRRGQFLPPFIVLHGHHGQSLNYFGRISSLFASFQVRKPRSRWCCLEKYDENGAASLLRMILLTATHRLGVLTQGKSRGTLS